MRRLLALPLLLACDAGDTGDGHDETEFITTVTLTLTAPVGTVTASFSDLDGPGGMSGSAETIVLAADTEYALDVAFLDELSDPPDDISAEIGAEAEDHLVLFDSAAVTVAYGDVESDYGGNAIGEDLPVGLSATATTTAATTGELRVVLRHLPAVNGEPQKVAGLPEMFAAGDPLPGDADADVTFPVEVQ